MLGFFGESEMKQKMSRGQYHHESALMLNIITCVRLQEHQKNRFTVFLKISYFCFKGFLKYARM